MRFLSQPIACAWGRGNKGKNAKHKVTDEECEEVFFDPRKKLPKDILHSRKEERYILLGATKHQRLLFVVFTPGNNRVRVISARDLHKREKMLCEEVA